METKETSRQEAQACCERSEQSLIILYSRARGPNKQGQERILSISHRSSCRNVCRCKGGWAYGEYGTRRWAQSTDQGAFWGLIWGPMNLLLTSIQELSMCFAPWSYSAIDKSPDCRILEPKSCARAAAVPSCTSFSWQLLVVAFAWSHLAVKQYCAWCMMIDQSAKSIGIA